MGFSVTMTKEGKGSPIGPGDEVQMHYTATLLDGTKVESSYDKVEPATFRVGTREVMKCWDEGLVGLRKGNKADLTCPANMVSGFKNVPADTDLLFSIEIVNVTPGKKPGKQQMN